MIELHYIRLRTPYHRHRSRNTTKHRFCLIILRHWWEITLVITKKKLVEESWRHGLCGLLPKFGDKLYDSNEFRDESHEKTPPS